MSIYSKKPENALSWPVEIASVVGGVVPASHERA